MDWMTTAGDFAMLLALGGVLIVVLGVVPVAVLAIAWDQHNTAPWALPGTLVRMMRRYGVSRRALESAGLGREFAGAYRKCKDCKRTMQCCDWLHDSETGDIPLFCPNEPFLARARTRALTLVPRVTNG